MALGVVAGLIRAVFLARTAESLLVGVTGVDPVSYLVASAIVLMTALAADAGAAARIGRVSPVDALRAE